MPTNQQLITESVTLTEAQLTLSILDATITKAIRDSIETAQVSPKLKRKAIHRMLNAAKCIREAHSILVGKVIVK